MLWLAGDLGLGQMFQNINILIMEFGLYRTCIKEALRFVIMGLICAAEIFLCLGKMEVNTCTSLCSTDSKLSPNIYFFFDFNVIIEIVTGHATPQNEDGISQVFFQLVWLCDYVSASGT